MTTGTFMVHVLGVWHSIKRVLLFELSSSFTSHNCFYHHFIDKETESQKVQMIWPESRSQA